MSVHAYLYPAIFTAEEEGGYSVTFPDIDCCFTDGDDLTSAMANSKDVLSLMLYEMEERKETIPHASSVFDIKKNLQENQFVNLIGCDTMEYRKFFRKKAVKKTLTIPEWLNDMAEDANISFSATLQEALKDKLGVN